MTKTGNTLRSLVGTVAGMLLLVLIVFFLYGFLRFLYFPAKPTPDRQDAFSDTFSKNIVQQLGMDHFHILDDTVYSDAENAPMCLRCHGNFCHNESKELRSFYNMHTFYVACETCHIRIPATQKVAFQWFDDRSGAALKQVSGSPGSYHAKIVPVRDGARLDAFPETDLALSYMEKKKSATAEEKRSMQQKLMAHLSDKAVTCRECHRRGGYLDFAALGFSKHRIDKLVQMEIMQLLDKEKDFYIPAMFDPRKAQRAIR